VISSVSDIKNYPETANNSLIMVILLILRLSHTKIDIDAESMTIKTTCDLRKIGMLRD
jgi:hypothetical protein